MTLVVADAVTETPARTRPALADLWAPLLLYVGTRIVQLLFIAWLAPAGGPSIRSRLLAWDGDWFMRVATQGYPHTYSYDASGQMVGNGLAFFPAYPLLIRGLWKLGVPADIAALSISWLAGAVAAVLLYLLGTELVDRRVGLVLTALFLAQPMSVVFSMGYSEALFSALVIGMFYAAYRRAFLVAGVLGLGAALTRPTGLAAAVGLAVAAVLAMRAGTVPGWRAATGALVALAGVPAYLLWVAARVGDLNAWFTIQTAGWGTTFDWGRSTWNFLVTAIHQGNGYVLGEQGGTETVTLTTQTMPVHTHVPQASTTATAPPNVTSPSGGVWAQSTLNDYSSAAPSSNMDPTAIGPAGGSQPHDNMIPFLAVNFILSLFGVFPSQT